MVDTSGDDESVRYRAGSHGKRPSPIREDEGKEQVLLLHSQGINLYA